MAWCSWLIFFSCSTTVLLVFKSNSVSMNIVQCIWIIPPFTLLCESGWLFWCNFGLCSWYCSTLPCEETKGDWPLLFSQLGSPKINLENIMQVMRQSSKKLQSNILEPMARVDRVEMKQSWGMTALVGIWRQLFLLDIHNNVDRMQNNGVLRDQMTGATTWR